MFLYYEEGKLGMQKTFTRNRKRWSKQHLPVITAQQDVVGLDGSYSGSKTLTPYRLPRIDADSPSKLYADCHYSSRFWGPHGYESVFRIPEFGPEVKKHYVNPPKIVAPHYRQASMKVPKFQTAAITPTMKAIPLNKETTDDLEAYQSELRKGMSGEDCTGEYFPPGPTPTPVGRSFSPTKSVKSIHWALGSTKHPMFDKKGRGRVQGPYSREFTVTCYAPNNWLKMKLGRARVS